MIRDEIPMKIRVSLGSAILLNFIKGELDEAPTTIYLLTYRQGKCTANCSFCSQARSSASRADLLSRVIWPAFPSIEVMKKIENSGEGLIKRVCIQTMNYPGMFS
jgi:biotin synthase-related radical SAM superfamily protein